MKKTIKQWCVDCGINWYGQGKISMLAYDWKLAFGAGRTAFFSSAIGSTKPEIHLINGKEVYMFPNVNSANDHGKISEDRFKRMMDWVHQCLDGNIREF